MSELLEPGDHFVWILGVRFTTAVVVIRPYDVCVDYRELHGANTVTRDT